MRRLGRALLRSTPVRWSVLLTVLLGLVGGNTVMVASTVYAASHGPGLLGSLGLGGNGDEQGDSQGSSIPQGDCLLPFLPLLCQSGTPPAVTSPGVGATDQPTTRSAPAPARHPTHPHVLAPSTGGLLSGGCVPLLTCPPPAPAATPSPTAKPTTTTASPTSQSGSSTPAPTPAPSASASNCGLLGTGLLCPPTSVSGSSTGSPTPAPTPGLSLLGGAVQIGGTCAANNLVCLGGQTTSGGSGSGSGSGSTGASSGACVANLLCLLGSSCTASVANTCLLGAILPALPGSSSGSPSDPSGSTGSSGGAGSGGGSSPQGGSQPTGTLSSQGSIALGTVPIGSPQSSGAGQGGDGAATGLAPKADQSVGLVSGLSFGHGLILWPLFGLLDLAALAGLVVVVRRRWSATSS